MRSLLATITSALIALSMGGAAVSASSGAAGSLKPDTRFYRAPSDPGATQQIAQLKAQGKAGAARKLKAMVRAPGSVWFTDGTLLELMRNAAPSF